MSEKEVKELRRLKQNEFLKPYAKLLIMIQKGYHDTKILKDVLGGNYITLIKDGVRKGHVIYEEKGKVSLTYKGSEIAQSLLKCWKALEERARETEREKEKKSME